MPRLTNLLNIYNITPGPLWGGVTSITDLKMYWDQPPISCLNSFWEPPLRGDTQVHPCQGGCYYPSHFTKAKLRHTKVKCPRSRSLTAYSVTYVFMHLSSDGAGGSEVNVAVLVLVEHRIWWGLGADTAEHLAKSLGFSLVQLRGWTVSLCGQLCLSATHQLCQFSRLLDLWWR